MVQSLSRRVRGYAVLVVAGGLLASCASRQPTSLADSLVAKGEPELVIGDPVRYTETLLDPDAKPPPLEDLEVVRSVSMAPAASRLEDADPELSNALGVAAARPSPAAHRRVAELYQGHGIMDMAYDHLLDAERLDPSDPATQDYMARLWRAWDLASIGLGAAYRAVSLAPDSPEAHNTMGTLLQAVGEPEHAQRAFERGLELDPTAAYILNNLCDLTMRRGDLDEAVALCQAALALDPALSEAGNNLAILYFATGRDELAWKALQDVGPASTAMYNLGIAHLARGNQSAAAVAFGASSKAKPNWAEPRHRAKQARAQSTTGP